MLGSGLLVLFKTSIPQSQTKTKTAIHSAQFTWRLLQMHHKLTAPVPLNKPRRHTNTSDLVHGRVTRSPASLQSARQPATRDGACCRPAARRGRPSASGRVGTGRRRQGDGGGPAGSGQRRRDGATPAAVKRGKQAPAESDRSLNRPPPQPRGTAVGTFKPADWRGGSALQ